MRRVQAARFRVPEDIGIVHPAVDDDVLDWAGIHSGLGEAQGAVKKRAAIVRRQHLFDRSYLFRTAGKTINQQNPWNKARQFLKTGSLAFATAADALSGEKHAQPAEHHRAGRRFRDGCFNQLKAK